MRKEIKCGAYARSTGMPCRAGALRNGRCRMHGGLSTGPKTEEGRRAVGEATRNRMRPGQQEKALKGFYQWLEGGGRQHLSRLATERFKHRQYLIP
jgi:hypothetical protein